MANGNLWTREQEILAFDLYFKTPFGKIHHSNPDIIELARKIGRSPSAVSMKMCNFANLDPELDRTGLKNVSKQDREIWTEFNNDWESLVQEVSDIKTRLEIEQKNYDDEELPEGTDRRSYVKVRQNQDFFRDAVLSAYDNKCCITGIAMPVLLAASHIKPWRVSDSKTERTNPCNGLSLNYLHDKAFDQGLITLDFDYKLVISKTLRDRYSSQVISDYFKNYEGKQIMLPSRCLPSKEFLEYHNNYVFEKIL